VSERGLWEPNAPLAERLRPRELAGVLGQPHLLGPHGPLRALAERGSFGALLFWGPPGSGKTTVGRIIAANVGARFVQLSAALTGVSEVRRMLERSRELWKRAGQQELLFLDEIHRFNRAQQDVLLPFLEEGSVRFVGATTENPSFVLRPALLSRAQLFIFDPLGEAELLELLHRALEDPAGYGGRVSLDAEARALVVRRSDGDARRMLAALETCVAAHGEGHLDRQAVAEALGRKALAYDRAGEEHYNLISALHKAVRNSDVDGTVYWLARMLTSGEDPRFIARRLVRMASEDIGLADPQGLPLAVAALTAVEHVGLPECDLALTQAAVYLALAPKSNALYTGYAAAQHDVQRAPAEPVPLHLRNPVTETMRDIGYGAGYRYAHDEPELVAAMITLPPGLAERTYFRPGAQGWEGRIRERLQELRARLRAARTTEGGKP